MVVIFRLKRRFFFYNSLVALSIVVILLFVYSGFFEISFYIINKSNFHCPSEEPIDIVYTWVNGSDPEFIKNLNKFVNGKNESFDISKQRFDDKYELKFSLRSLEKYAPWVNHVYIVTNGQIPYWLNLDYEKVTVITHDEIFRKKIGLPTFSSPAIESNLHRIPGLSKKFIYFNDDIFLGQPTYAEDFFSPNKGFLIYLAWPVPQCSPNCPWMYVADGQCDKDCFRPECQMDGGDCENSEDKTTLEVTTEELDNIIEDYDAKDRVLADTVQRVRANFYRSFMKKLMPFRVTAKNLKQAASEITSPNSKRSNYLLNVFSLNDMRNLSNFVNQHNKLTIKNDKMRRKRRRRRSFYKIGNGTLLEKLLPKINIDAYSASLQHTNRLLNRKYGFKSRRVPSHAPILIDRDIMEELRSTFEREFAVTERNRVRRGDDIQFSFSYYYFLISETVKRGIEDIFDEFDTDCSSTWSDREIRTLLTQLYELPLSYATVDHFESSLLNCTENGNFPEGVTPPYERYVDSKLPTIAKNLVIHCPSLVSILKQRFGTTPKYAYEIVPNAESKYVTFKMLNSNISDVIGNLDDIRNDRRKFICLNDNLDEAKASENELVRAILYDFYVSFFPHPSKFELPEEYRNKFGYIQELNQWKGYHFKIKLFVYCLVLSLLCFTFYSICKKKCCQIVNKLFFC
ncbi:N-acetylglucosamine-1-phosphotransferase subunits alpha/beta [Anoplophora glabripennis]|nr:N-acetylglucosamine-1-phosphotransferase subunits alpha/beta [Anoplophora glabripennis]